MNSIIFEIGDWSQDGHNQSEIFYAMSNKTVEELRELHFAFTEKAGFGIGDICGDYEESELTEDQIIFFHDNNFFDHPLFEDEFKELFSMLTKESQDSFNGPVEEQFLDCGGGCGVDMNMGGEQVVHLWVECLKWMDPTAEIELASGEVDLFKRTSTATSKPVAEIISGLLELISDDQNEIVIRAKNLISNREEDSKPNSMHFYGFDPLNRHLKVPGYGVFYC